MQPHDAPKNPHSPPRAFAGLATMLMVLAALSSCAHASTVRDASGLPLELEIATIEDVELNGVRQWIYVSGVSADNPVLLWLDGGPGGAEVAWVRKYLGPLHREFTIVCWDQRGTARSWGSARMRGASTVEDYVDDTIALSRALAARFGKEKIYLVGHSWGSIIGLKAAAREPELYAAYVGVGQQINATENDGIGWDMVHGGATREGNAKVARTLERYGKPPYTDGKRYLYLFSRLYRYSPHPSAYGDFDSLLMFFAPEHRLIDRLNLMRGLMNGVKGVYPQLADLDFERDLPRVECPLFIVNGRYDYTCVATIAERWFDSVEAPLKDLLWLENSGHTACYTEADAFMRYMRDTVLARTKGTAR